MSKLTRLLDFFIPEIYQLNLAISKAKRQFFGTVTITGQPQTNIIRLHSVNLDIKNVLTGDGKPLDWRLADNELIIYQAINKFSIEFSGTISDTAMNGLYLCKYKYNNQDCTLFATQFESHYARKCFPCIDEPAAKATFAISLTSLDDDVDTILSNMPGEKHGNTWTFATTPRMSTYLVAFVGGKFIHKTAQTGRGVVINAYATPAQSADSLDYALTTAVRSIEFYERYFGVDYPLPKLDNVALPDFSAGAMENWGLITYRESALLVDKRSSPQLKEYVATVIAHEISHQWFGNLVTMQWWNDLWLNESFATLMENTATDHLYPDYHVWDTFAINDIPSAMSVDALPSVQALQQDVSSPDEIATLFDGAIVYAKGCRLLIMLRTLIGETAFRQALTNYFHRHAYDNTTAEDLWQAMAEASQIDIKTVMTPWLTQPGYPIVSILKKLDQLSINQERFCLGGASPSNTIWPIPLASNTANLPKLLTTKEITIKDQTGKLVNINRDSSSHFITNYDEALMDKLIVNFASLSTRDKIKLLNESWLLARSGRQDISRTLRLISQVKDEDESAILYTASSLISGLKTLVEPDTTTETKLIRLCNQTFSRQFSDLFTGQPNKKLTNDQQKALGYVLSASVYGQNPEAIRYCLNVFSDHQIDPSTITESIRSSVLITVIKYDHKAHFDDFWKLYLETSSPSYQSSLLTALVSAKQFRQLSVLISSLTDTSKIRPQDTLAVVYGLFGNKSSRDATWRWITQNWSWIKEVFGDDMDYKGFVDAASSYPRTAAELAKYDQFFNKIEISNPALARSIQMGRQRISTRLKLIERNQPILATLDC